MKSESEKKNKTKSIKLSPKQEQIIMEKAQAKGMNFSEYMIDSALHGNDGTTPLIAVKVQELINCVREIADDVVAADYMKRKELNQKSDDLSGFFKPASPKEKYDVLKKNVYKVIEEGDEIWESLK